MEKIKKNINMPIVGEWLVLMAGDWIVHANNFYLKPVISLRMDIDIPREDMHSTLQVIRKFISETDLSILTIVNFQI